MLQGDLVWHLMESIWRRVGFCGGWEILFVIFAVGENTVWRDFAFCAKHVGLWVGCKLGVPFGVSLREKPVGRDFALCAKHVGGQRWNRTTDTGIFNPLLYRLSYLAVTQTRAY